MSVPFGMKRFLIILSTLVYFACSNDVKLTLISQEEKIDSYLANNKFNDTSVVIRNKGANRVYLGFVHDYIVTDTIINGRDTTYVTQEIPIKDTVYIDYGDSIYISYAGYVFTSAPSSLFATNVAELAQKAGWDMSKVDTLPKGILLRKGHLYRGSSMVCTMPEKRSIAWFSSLQNTVLEILKCTIYPDCPPSLMRL